jgi:uncharacterized caspase-like protein
MFARRIALIIGVSNYDARLGRLPNAVRDAEDMEQRLQTAGFEIFGGGCTA